MQYIGKYYSIKPQRVLQIEEIYTIHYFENYKNYFFPGERHPFWELVYIDRGEIIMETDRIAEPIHMAQGDLLMHRPDEFHRFYANDITPHNLFVISFHTNSPVMRFFEEYPLHHMLPKAMSQISRIISEAKQCFVGSQQDPNIPQLQRNPNAQLGAEQMITIMLEFLLLQLCRGENTRTEEDAQRGRQEKLSESYIESAIEFLKHRVQMATSLPDVCAQVGVSRSQLQKMFYRTTGKNVMQYLRELRIEEAKFMIRSQNVNFTEIAHLLCYSSVHHFSRQFRNITGMSPSEYAASIHALTDATEFVPAGAGSTHP